MCLFPLIHFIHVTKVFTLNNIIVIVVTSIMNSDVPSCQKRAIKLTLKKHDLLGRIAPSTGCSLQIHTVQQTEIQNNLNRYKEH